MDYLLTLYVIYITLKMFKKILTVFIGSMAAIWISAGVMLVLFFMIIGAMFSSDSTQTVNKHSILHLDLNGEISEYPEKLDISDIIESDGQLPGRLDQILESVKLAAYDPNIDCIILECSGSALGYAGRQELMEALLQFRKESGKKVYAYGNIYTQGDYYVASAADKIVVNPSGMVDVSGIGASIPFFKNALDKLGVTVQVMKVGQFKSAVEPYILNEPSEASRLQSMEYINAMWKSVAGSIAANRKVKTATVTAWADSLLMTADPASLVKAKVVDATQYRRQFDDDMRTATSLQKGEDLRLVTPADYILSDPHTRLVKQDNIKEDKVTNEGYFAVLYAVGDIVDAGDKGIVGDKIVGEILKIADDDNVKGLVLRVNSPGGSAFASEQIWESLEYFKSKGKPFYVSMSDYAASGGYYISCGADRIYADENTITGSIGIFGLIPCIHDLLTDKLGVNIVPVANTANANFPSITRPMTPYQQQAMQGYVERGYELFTSRVAKGRKMSVNKVKEIAEGRVWIGTKAKEIGLVDELGGIEDAIAAMAKKLNMSTDNYVSLPEYQMSALEQWFVATNSAENEMQAKITGSVSDGSLRSDIRNILSMQRNLPQIPGVDAETVKANLNLLLGVRRQGFVQARMQPLSIQ